MTDTPCSYLVGSDAFGSFKHTRPLTSREAGDKNHGEGGLPARKNNRFRKKDDSENMDIPVMPHPGTDTQASPYQSRQTKEIT